MSRYPGNPGAPFVGPDATPEQESATAAANAAARAAQATAANANLPEVVPEPTGSDTGASSPPPRSSAGTLSRLRVSLSEKLSIVGRKARKEGRQRALQESLDDLAKERELNQANQQRISDLQAAVERLQRQLREGSTNSSFASSVGGNEPVGGNPSTGQLSIRTGPIPFTEVGTLTPVYEAGAPPTPTSAPGSTHNPPVSSARVDTTAMPGPPEDNDDISSKATHPSTYNTW